MGQSPFRQSPDEGAAERRDRALSASVAGIVGMLEYRLGMDPNLPPEALTLDSARKLLTDVHDRLKQALDDRAAE